MATIRTLADLENAQRDEDNMLNLVQADMAGADLRGAILNLADLQGANLEGANLEGANLQGSNLEEANLSGANLRGANLQRTTIYFANLRNADLTGANLSFADIEGTNITGAILTNAITANVNMDDAVMDATPRDEAHLRIRCIADLENVPRHPTTGAYNLRGADLTNANLIRANLQGANLEDAIILETHFEYANLQGANIRGTNIERACLLDANLEGANLEGANIIESDLGGANLQHTNLRNTTMTDCNLIDTLFFQSDREGANIPNLDDGFLGRTRMIITPVVRIRRVADLQNVVNDMGIYDLKYANLEGAVLQNIDFTEADLFGANLRGANLQGSIFEFAILDYADFTGANLQRANMTQANLSGTILNNANLNRANMTGANIDNIIINGPHNHTRVQIIEQRTGRRYVEIDEDDEDHVDIHRRNREQQRIQQLELDLEEQPDGLAFEIHNAFDKINVISLIDFLKSKVEDGNEEEQRFAEMSSRDFVQEINNMITRVLDSVSADELYTIPTKPAGYYPPSIFSWLDIWNLIYNSRFKFINFNDELTRKLLGLSLDYVLMQPPSFQTNYILAYLGDNAFAYSTGNTFMHNISCAKGIMERVVISILPAIISATTVELPEDINNDYNTLKTKIEGGFDENVAIEMITQWQEDNKNVITRENGEFNTNKIQLIHQQKNALIRYLIYVAI